MRVHVNGKLLESAQIEDNVETILRKSGNEGDYTLMNVRTREFFRGTDKPIDPDEDNWFRVYLPPIKIGRK